MSPTKLAAVFLFDIQTFQHSVAHGQVFSKKILWTLELDMFSKSDIHLTLNRWSVFNNFRRRLTLSLPEKASWVNDALPTLQEDLVLSVRLGSGEVIVVLKKKMLHFVFRTPWNAVPIEGGNTIEKNVNLKRENTQFDRISSEIWNCNKFIRLCIANKLHEKNVRNDSGRDVFKSFLFLVVPSPIDHFKTLQANSWEFVLERSFKSILAELQHTYLREFCKILVMFRSNSLQRSWTK